MKRVSYINPEYKITEFSKEKQRAVILLDHHKRKITTGEYAGQEGISLSRVYGRDGKKISEIISQLMNGWVDVANDSWIFDLQGNKQVTPVIDFLIEAGVPFDSAIAFVSNPLVIEYIKEQRIAQSPVSKPNNLNAFSKNEYRTQAKVAIFNKLNMGFLTEDKPVFNDRHVEIGKKPGVNYDELNALTLKLTEGKDFTKSALTLAEKDYATAAASTDARAALLHFMELENIAKQVANVKINLNYDTSRSNNLFDAAINNEYIRNRILLSLEKNPKSVKDLATQLNIDSKEALNHILVLKGRNQVVMEDIIENQPIYINVMERYKNGKSRSSFNCWSRNWRFSSSARLSRIRL